MVFGINIDEVSSMILVHHVSILKSMSPSVSFLILSDMESTVFFNSSCALWMLPISCFTMRSPCMATESLMMFMAMQRFSTNDALRAILSISYLVYLAGDAVCSMIGSMREMG